MKCYKHLTQRIVLIKVEHSTEHGTTWLQDAKSNGDMKTVGYKIGKKEFKILIIILFPMYFI